MARDNMENPIDTNRWNAKLDAFRSTTDFTDLLRIVASYYEMYSRAATFVGPWIAKQHNNAMTLPPDKEMIKEALGKERPTISYKARTAFIESLYQFMIKSKGRKTLITPNPSSHHSAQFPQGTFTISLVGEDDRPALRDDRAPRRESKTLHKITFAGAENPVYVENLNIPVDQINFLIARPKLGKLGTPSTNRWEILFYKRHHGYIIDHVDSHLNPRWSGIM